MAKELKKKTQDRKYMPSAVTVHPPTTCLECGSTLTVIYVVITDFPYVHADLKLACTYCDFEMLYGVPLDELAGMTLQIFDTQPLSRNYEGIKKLETPECPVHKKRMVMTKIFGDLVLDDGCFRVQFKCPKCFLTKHIDGRFDEKAKRKIDRQVFESDIKSRLKKLGYV